MNARVAFLSAMWGVFACIAAVSAGEPKLVFEDPFEGKRAEGWNWLRENPTAWRIRDDALEIRVEPGVAPTAKNVLFRPVPDRSQAAFAAEVTVTFNTQPSNQFEQAGLAWYTGDKPGVKLVHEWINGASYVIPGKIATETRTVQLRLVFSAKQFVAQFRPDGKGEFRTVQTLPAPAPGPNDRIALVCYNGPANEEHWMRFDDFRIVELPKD